LLAPIAVFGTALLRGSLIAPNDAWHDYLPWHIVAAHIWRTGRIPLWDPYVFSGFPLLAIGQAGVLYPPTWLFVVLPFGVANNLYVIAHFCIAGLGARALARRLYEDDVAATLGGVAFGLCGFLFAHIGHQDLLAVVSWLPWCVVGIDRLRDSFTWKRLAGAAAPLAASCLAGHFQLFTFNVLVVAAFAALVALTDRTRPRGRTLMVSALGIAAAGAFAAIQLAPSLKLVGSTVRSTVSFSFATTYALPKTHVFLLLFPYLFGAFKSGPFPHGYHGSWNLLEMTGYPGAATLVLAGAGLIGSHRDRRTLALVIIGATSAVVALGASTPLAHVVYAIPILGQFRAWSRYLVATDLAIAMLAARGLAELRTKRLMGIPRLSGVAVALGIGAAALAASRLAPVQRFLPDGHVAAWSVLLPVGLAATAAALIVVVRRRTILSAALIAVVIVDLVFAFGWWHDWRTGSPNGAAYARRIASSSTPWGPLPFDREGARRYLYIGNAPDDLGESFVDITDAQKIYSANGVDSLAPSNYLAAVGKMTFYGSVSDAAPIIRPRSKVLDLLRVSVVLTSTRDELPLGPTLLRHRVHIRGTHVVRYRYRPRMAEVSLIGDVSTKSRAAITARLTGARSFDPSRVVLLERSCRSCPRHQRVGTGSARIVARSPGELDIAVRAHHPAMLLVSQGWLPGWTATVDGRTEPVLRADGLIQTLRVPSGTPLVRMRYTAPGFRLGFALSAGTAVIVGLGVVYERRKRRKPKRSLL